jgi:molecular chaperone DnaK (HSP70)
MSKVFTIKSNSCNRLYKDYLCYLKEDEDEKEKLEKLMEVENPDIYKIKFQKEVIDENNNVLISLKEKLKNSIHELEECLKNEETSVEYTNALKIFQITSKFFDSE